MVDWLAVSSLVLRACRFAFFSRLGVVMYCERHLDYSARFCNKCASFFKDALCFYFGFVRFGRMLGGSW